MTPLAIETAEAFVFDPVAGIDVFVLEGRVVISLVAAANAFAVIVRDRRRLSMAAASIALVEIAVVVGRLLVREASGIGHLAVSCKTCAAEIT